MTPDYLFVSGNSGVSNEKESFGVWSTLDTDDVSTRSKNGYRTEQSKDDGLTKHWQHWWVDCVCV